MVDQSNRIKMWSWSHYLRNLWDELQRSINWTWLLPFVIVALSILLSRSTTPPPNTTGAGGQHNASSETTKTAHKPERTASTPDYASNLRSDFELYIPLVSVFLAVPPLAREWQHGTIAPLALRKSLLRILLERLGAVLLYLLIVVFVTATVSLLVTIQPPDNGAVGVWLWDILRTVGPTTLFCTASALLVAILTVNAAAGYVVAVGLWGINFFCLELLTLQHGSAGDILLYSFNGWRAHDQITHPDQWWIGKIIWLVAGVLCLLGALMLLRYEARLLRNTAE